MLTVTLGESADDARSYGYTFEVTELPNAAVTVSGNRMSPLLWLPMLSHTLVIVYCATYYSVEPNLDICALV